MPNIPTISIFAAIITLLTIISVSSNSIQCVKYLSHLEYLNKHNKTQFAQQMAPYLLLSGKAIDDMGFGGMCMQNPKYAFTTVKMQATNSNSNQTNDQNFVYTVYYGFCFTSNCTSSDLNQNGQFIINDILQNKFISINSIEFIPVSMDPSFSSGALVVCLLITVWMILSLVGPLSRWFGQCAQEDHSQQPHSEAPIQMNQKLSQHDHQQQQREQIYTEPTNSFFHKISIGRQWRWLSTQQQTKKIIQFSLYKILTIPIIIFGSIFYMNNYGAYNYFSFDNEIYSTFYSKVSTFVYYLPDGFFFISGFVFARGIMWRCRSLKQDETMSQLQTPNGIILKSVFSKFIRLYPIYIICLVIFWVIVPSLHAGPIWNAYENQANACNSNWWKNIFMIDNFSNDGCFTFSWWVQLDMQYAFLSGIFFLIFYYRKLYALIGAYVVLITGWILVFAISAKMPISLEHTLSSSSQTYFKSFHSHLPFYVSGLLCAFFCQKESVRSTINLGYVQNKSVFTIGNLISFGLMIFILLRPGVWSENMQGFELGLCRFGVFLCLTIFFLPGMVNQETNKTKVHKMAQLSYPILLISGIVVMSSYWCLQTFPYTSGMNILNNTLPNFFLSVAVGIVLGLLFNVKNMLKD